MSFLMRQVAHCDVCGHEWLTKKVPSHCAKCKSRKWNYEAPPQFDKAQVQHPPISEVVQGKAPRLPIAPERTVEYEE